MSEARVLDRPRRPHLLGDSLWPEPEYRGLELQRIRQSLGISGWDMAAALDVPPTSISRVECGDPKFAELRRREQEFLRRHILSHWPKVNER